MQDAIIAGDLGPNPAPVCELVWALFRQRGLRAREAFLLTHTHAQQHIHELRHGLDMLGQVLGDDALAWEGVHVDVVRNEAGTVVDDELHPSDRAAWTRARWDNFRRAIRVAGSRPVVFGLVGGRRRTMGAVTAAMYQLLARPQDLCLDVRVDEARVEGARAGFFFPDQPEPCADEDGLIDPRSVQVLLVDLGLPRLRRILHDRDLHTYEQALAATGVALDETAIPRVLVDIVASRLVIAGVEVKLSEGQFIWFATLALARVETADGWVFSTAHDGLLRRVMGVLASTTGGWQTRSRTLQRIREGDETVLPEDLRKLKADTRRGIREHCRRHRLVRQDLVIPEIDHHVDGWRQRLPLDPEHIRVVIGGPA